MKLSLFTTATDPVRRGDPYREALENYQFADEVIVVDGGRTWLEEDLPPAQFYRFNWPYEFEWHLIGQQFQRGYEAATGDWVIHADLDFFFHENDFDNIRKVCEQHNNEPALSFWKYQIFTPDRYNLKSRLVVAVNKGKFKDRIRFDGGGDLCQPTLDEKYIDPIKVPEARVPIWNYDEVFKTQEQIREDKGRFARAWQRTFGAYKLGGPDDDSAYAEWFLMVEGRYQKHLNPLKMDSHPQSIQQRLSELLPENFGWDAFGLKGRYFG